MMAFLKAYRFHVSDEHTGDPIRQVVYDFDFKDADSTVRFTVTSETGRLLFYVELSIDLPRPARMGSNFIASIRYRPATMKNCSMP